MGILQRIDKNNFEAMKYMSKWQFKKIVYKYVTELNKAELLDNAKSYKKVDYGSLAKEEFKRKDYFSQLNLEQVRERFRIQSLMFGGFKGSFPSKFRRQCLSLKCEMCKHVLESNTTLDDTSVENMETQKHFLDFCPLVTDINAQYNTDTDLGIISFFTAVLERRSELINS